ncbi:MAG: site-specific integrase [Tenericutes bacterium]|nr:site-specific integrase [Mycoplasmatota bacterium]
MHKYLLGELKKIKESINELETYFNGYNLLSNPSEKKTFEVYYDNINKCYSVGQTESYIESETKTPNRNDVFEEKGDIIMKLKEGSISKRKDGRWQGRYYDNGLRKCLYASTKKEIVLKINKAIVERNLNKKERLISNKITLNKWIVEWMKIYKDELAAASYKDYKVYLIGKVKNSPIGNKQVRHINSMDLERFFLSIQAPTGRHRTYLLMKGCFNKLAQTKIIKENPFDYIDTIKKPKAKEKVIPTSIELNKFFEYLKEKDYNLYQFAKFISVSGLRKGEALALEWQDITDKIAITKSFNTIMGKVSTPKTRASIRTIPLFKEAQDILNELDKTSSRVFAKVSLWRSARNFSTHATNFGLENVSLHILRHYFATQCLNAGIAKMVTSSWLGHEDSKVTENIYQHIKTDFEDEQIKKLAKYRASKNNV